MRSSIYIKKELHERLLNVSQRLGITKDDIISILISKILINKAFKPRLYESIKYQDSSPDIVWKRLHVEFEPVFYEKALDLRRNFKFSVSWFISFAIINYLDKILKKLSNSDNSNLILDNYDRNFVYIANSYDGVQVFITMMGFPQEKYLKNFLI